MALTDEGGSTGMVMPVSPYYGGGNGNGWGDNGSWWFILLILAMFGGWGGGFGGFGGNAIANDAAVLYPWMNQANQISNGFDTAAIGTTLSGIQSAVTSGFGDVQTALCGGFAGVNAGVSNGFAQAEIANNARQIANMQQAFAAQTATTQGFTNLSSQLASCCCDNRLATANLQSTMMAEHCADRAAVSDGIRDILVASNANTQRILDTMCQDKIDAKNEKIADLERQLTMANLAASQGAQTAAILANNEAQTTALEQYLAPVPRPAYIVQNPSCCNQTFGCGCGA